MNAVDVRYQHYYSLVYMARNDMLENVIYRVSFEAWVQAGIAYNTRAQELSSRKVSAFAKVYRTLRRLQGASYEDVISSEKSNMLLLYLQYFYEDLFWLYESYVESSHKSKLAQASAKTMCVPKHPVIIPHWYDDCVLRLLAEEFRPTPEMLKDVAEENSANITFIKADKDTETFRSMCAIKCTQGKKGGSLLIYD